MEGLVDGNIFDFEQVQFKPQFKRQKISEIDENEEIKDFPVAQTEEKAKVRNDFDEPIEINQIDNNFTVMNLENQCTLESKINFS